MSFTSYKYNILKYDISNQAKLNITNFKSKPNMNNSENISYQAGQAKGQAQEKSNQMMERASNAAQSAKETMQEAGQQMKATAQGAADAVKNATGMNK
ncbi:hypothetical protein HAX54_036911 [Datura stramonium]|uniref:Stress-induced protein KIN2-like n=1 Tax=Datura stramonium TaxID=4076 RepID=A0ABS8VIR5_DATST|nr:hypothetical protein [Datura stramonium]